MIDWKKFADENNLSPKEFISTLLQATAIACAMFIDENLEEHDTLRYKAEDNVGEIEVFVRRVAEDEES